MRARIAALGCLVVLAAACGSSSSSGGPTVAVALTPQGCDPAALTVAPGKTTFHVTNEGADAITEFEVLDNGKIVGEKENVTPGLDGAFTVDLHEGTYQTLCPGGTDHATGTLTVAAAGASPAPVASSSSGACAPSDDSSAAAATVDATLTDYKIELSPATVAAGTVHINATNASTTHAHEIVIVKGVGAADLPRDSDGAVDEDKLPDGAKVGEVEKFAQGNTCGATFDLPPGTYTLFCNVVGEEGAHVMLGMVTTLTVT